MSGLHLHHDGLSRPIEAPAIRALSLGAGVQSTVLALMADRGELGPKPDCAVFADTGWEPDAVYEHLAWLKTVLSFPVIVVKRRGPDLGQLMLEIARTGIEEGSPAMIPYFVGDGGMIPKQCSKEFKTRVVSGEIRRQLGLAPRQRGSKAIPVELWIGISTDEIVRMKRNEVPWITNRWPLIEARMSRRDCLAWLAERQYSAPRSACVFCPFRGKAEWRDMRDSAPRDFERACDFDAAVRAAHPSGAYLLKERVALAEADLDAPEAPGGLFGAMADECEGMCGV